MKAVEVEASELGIRKATVKGCLTNLRRGGLDDDCLRTAFETVSWRFEILGIKDFESPTLLPIWQDKLDSSWRMHRLGKPGAA